MSNPGYDPPPEGQEPQQQVVRWDQLELFAPEAPQGEPPSQIPDFIPVPEPSGGKDPEPAAAAAPEEPAEAAPPAAAAEGEAAPPAAESPPPAAAEAPAAAAAAAAAAGGGPVYPPGVDPKKPWKAVILNFKGVTVSPELMRKFLQNYVKENAAKYCQEAWNDKYVQKDWLDLIKYESNHISKEVPRLERNGGRPEQQASLVKFVQYHLEKNLKENPCSSFMKHMFYYYYKKRQVKTPSYPDVNEWLGLLKKRGVYVYSFGDNKKEAQKLFYGTTDHGNYTKFIQGYLDPWADGDKNKPETWKRVLRKIQRSAASCRYITATVPDAKAARDAGLSVAVIARPGEPQPADLDGIQLIASFDELGFQK